MSKLRVVRECGKSRIVQKTALETAAARRLGKNHSLLFSLTPRLSFFVQDSASGRQAEEGEGKIWESVIGKNRQ